MTNPIVIKSVAQEWIKAVIIAVLFAIAFMGGWFVADWRKGAELERIKGQNALLSTASGKCEVDVKNVRAAMVALAMEAEARIKQAEEAMRQTEPQVKERTTVITQIKALPQVAPDKQCQAIEQEQIEYLRMRRGT